MHHSWSAEKVMRKKGGRKEDLNLLNLLHFFPPFVMEYSWNVVKLASEVAPIPRRYFTVVTHEDRFYFFGGHKPSKEATNDFSVFNPSQFPPPHHPPGHS